MDECVVVNVEFFGDDGTIPGIIKIPYDITWPDFELLLKLNFDCPEVIVKYLDEDGDQILMSSQDELFEAFQHAKQSKNVLGVTVERGQERETTRPGPEKTLVDETLDSTPARLVHVDAPIQTDLLQDTVVASATESLLGEDTALLTDLLRDSPMLTEVEPAAEQANSLDVIRCDTSDTEETGELLQPTCTDPKPAAYIEIKHRGARAKARRGDCYSRCAKEMGDNYYRHSQSEDRRKYKRTCSPRDRESGETQQSADAPVSYNILTEFLGKLKEDLRTEIVRDVTRKTVKQVLKGLDGAVIQTVQGSKLCADPSLVDQETAATQRTHPSYVHDGITCDHCDQTIVGVRYKCGNCLDYDLCEPCESTDSIHTPDHVFVKLRRPCSTAGKVNGTAQPLLQFEIYRTMIDAEDGGPDSPDPITGGEQAPALPEELKTHPRWEKFKEKMVRMQEKLKKKEEKLMVKHKRKEEKLKRRLEQERSVPLKREKLDIPQLKRQGKYDAKFIEDVTIPDGTRVQPGTKLHKMWILRNTGNTIWSETTKLRMMWGNMAATKTEVIVPYLTPGDQGTITVELIAPTEPGRYQSHWKMYDDGVNFGHRVWCAVIVEPKEVLEPSCAHSLKVLSQPETGEPTQGPHIPISSPPSQIMVTEAPEVVTMETREAAAMVTMDDTMVTKEDVEKAGSDKVEEDLVTAAAAVAKLKQEQTTLPITPELTKGDNYSKDLLSFELVDAHHQRSPPKLSQTATPTNTPLDMTPPKSPVAGGPTDRAILSNSSSVEMVPEVVRTDGEEEPISMEMMDYVHERMASLGLRPELDFDLESLSSVSDEDSGSDGDFFIVPLPDCFDPSKPLTRSQMALAGQNEGPSDENCNTILDPTDANTDQTVDDILTASDIETPTLSPVPSETGVSMTSVLEVEPEVTDEITEELGALEISAAGAAAGDDLFTEAHRTPEEEVTPGEGERSQPGAEGSSCAGEEASAQTDPVSQPPSEKQDKASEGEHQAKAGDFANQLMSTAVSAATRAAAQAYSTAKEVFLTWQVKQQVDWEPKPTFVPPKSDWKPPADNYRPPQSTWTPPPDTYMPPASTWTPPVNDWTPPTENADRQTNPQPDSPTMTQLLEMGFFDRARNQELLDLLENDIQKVVQKLVETMDNDWAAGRH